MRSFRYRSSAALALTLLVTALSPLGGTGASSAVGAAPVGAADLDDAFAPLETTLPRARDGLPRLVNPTEYTAYRLDLPVLQRGLSRAPLETSAEGDPVLIEIPSPSGDLVEFAVKESPVLEDGLAAARPDIKTYAGRTTAPGSPASIRLDHTPLGFHASVRGDGATWYIDPAFNGPNQGADAPYLSYLGKDLPEPEKPLVEPEAITAGSRALTDEQAADALQRIGEGGNNPVRARTYRIAFTTDPTYSTYFAPDATTPAEYNLLVTAAKSTLMNRVNQLYGDDTSLRMLLVNDTDLTNFNTVADAYSAGGRCGEIACFVETDVANGCSGTLLTRNRQVLGQVIGAENFEAGHIGLGLNGGGLASLGVIGLANKAQGCTGLPSPVGDFYAVDYVAHELGHQFAGNHTFEGLNGSCSGANRNPGTSVEPGSGSSVMAYAGICQIDNLQPHTDPYFSQRSQTEIGTHINAVRTAINEIGTVSLVDYDATDSFTLTFPNYGTTAPIANGTNYTTAGIKAAVEAVTGGTVTVGNYFAGATFDTNGFQLTFSGARAGTAIVNPTLNVVSGDFSGQANDVVSGGVPTNGGKTTVVSDNRVPSVTAPPAKTIPTRTPFTLTGSATDLDAGDAGRILYLWEQNDRGEQIGGPLANLNRISGPLFRIFGTYADVTPAGTLQYESPGQNIATNNPSRTFPDLEQIIAGNTNAQDGTCPPGAPGTSGLPDGPALDCQSELLPTASYLSFDLDRSVNFRLTARDLGGADGGYDGGTSFADTKLTVSLLAGPFLVSSQDTNVIVPGNATGTVTWDVAGTNTAAMATQVRISLSTDGGRTYPHVLQAATPNDGTQTVTWPNVATTQARVKVEAVDNYFFDLNDSDFTITAVESLTLSGNTPGTFTGDYSDALGTKPKVTASSSAADGSAITAVPTGLPSGLTVTKQNVSADGASPGTADFVVTGTTTDAPGTYPVTLAVDDGSDPQQARFTVVIEPEDATASYTGPTEVTADSDAESAPIEMTAMVQEGTDGTLGDLTTATVTFTDTTTSEVLCADAPVTATGPGTGTSSCSVGADLPEDDGRTYSVALTVGGHYTGVSAADTDVTVTQDDGPPVDTTAPETTITSGPKNARFYLDRTVTYRYTSEPGVTYTCSFGGLTGACPTSGEITLGGLAEGATYRFAVAATDAAGNTDASPAVATMVIPFNDRSLKVAKKQWIKKRASASYRGTYQLARRKKATLTLRVRDVTKLALVLSRVRRGGMVDVFIGRQKLRTIKLTGKSSKKRVVTSVARFSEPRSGKVRIVSRNNRPVRIEGLAVRTSDATRP